MYVIFYHWLPYSNLWNTSPHHSLDHEEDVECICQFLHLNYSYDVQFFIIVFFLSTHSLNLTYTSDVVNDLLIILNRYDTSLFIRHYDLIEDNM